MLVHRRFTPKKVKHVCNYLVSGSENRPLIKCNLKTNMARKSIEHRRGVTKNRRFLERKETQAFLKVLKSVFPEATQGDDYIQWNWKEINTRKNNREKIFNLMLDYRVQDFTLFRNWDFEDFSCKPLQMKLSAYINTLKNSVMTKAKFTNDAQGLSLGITL